jgi:hypothetical protein
MQQRCVAWAEWYDVVEYRGMSQAGAPSEAYEFNNFNVLRKSLGRRYFIELQGVSAGLPKLYGRPIGVAWDDCSALDGTPLLSWPTKKQEKSASPAKRGALQYASTT